MQITSVDDEADFLAILDRILSGAFPTARLTSFQSPRLAFEHIQAHGTDVIVTNHQMGRISGTDLVRVLRVHGVEVPIVMICNNPDVCTEAIEAGANNFLDEAHIEELPGIIRSHFNWEISTLSGTESFLPKRRADESCFARSFHDPRVALISESRRKIP